MIESAGGCSVTTVVVLFVSRTEVVVVVTCLMLVFASDTDSVCSSSCELWMTLFPTSRTLVA